MSPLRNAGVFEALLRLSCMTCPLGLHGRHARAAPALSPSAPAIAMHTRKPRCVCAQPLQGHLHCRSHAGRLRRPPFARPYYDEPALDALDVRDDPVMLMVVDDAPGVACVRVIAVQAPVVSEHTASRRPISTRSCSDQLADQNNVGSTRFSSAPTQPRCSGLASSR